MMRSRNPLADRVAIVGIGSTEYGRDLGRTPLSLGLEAARKAILDAGLDKADLDGICGSGGMMGGANFLAVQEGLGIPRVTWCINAGLGAAVVHAVHAVFAGACETALVVQAFNRSAGWSQSARNDRLRVLATQFAGGGHGYGGFAQRWIHQGEPYGAWGGRYLHEFGAPREVFGLLAINNRSNAVLNEAAVMRTQITMDDYLSARSIYPPLGLLDCDLPVDCAEALVVTTVERARGLRHKPVLVHAVAFGQGQFGIEYYDNGRSYREAAPWVAMDELRLKSEHDITAVDLFFPYDGFTPIAICFTEAAGFCGPGEAWDLFRSSWDDERNRLVLNGRTLVSTNGGSLSHGRSGGMNYFTEAVRQLRGDAGPRQRPGAATALVGIGSYYHDPTATLLRTD
jgi:acetyl-CoA acetyltransferase